MAMACCREVEGRESNKGELLAVADEAGQVLDGHKTDVDGLTQELAKADDLAAEKEKEFITAKDAAAAIAARLAEAKCALPRATCWRLLAAGVCCSNTIFGVVTLWEEELLAAEVAGYLLQGGLSLTFLCPGTTSKELWACC